MRREAAHRVTTLVVVLAMALAACADTTDEAAPDTTAATVAQAAPETTAPGATAAPDEPPSDGDGVEVLRLAGLSGNGYPTPFAYRRGPGWLLTGMMFDTLLWEDSTGEPIAWLAESWSPRRTGSNGGSRCGTPHSTMGSR
jgi:ABC-type transport system substrate-binding protein